MHVRRGRSLFLVLLIAGFVISGLIGASVAPAQTPTESANILAATQGLTLTDAMRIAARQKLLDDARRAHLNTSAKATLIVAVDDQFKEWWNGTVNGISIRTICKTNGLKLGFSVSAWYIEHNDTVNSTLSVSNLRNMRDHDGAEIGSGGYFEGTMGGANGNWWHGDTGKLVTGAYTQAQLDAAMDLHFSGNRRALEDTLGLKTQGEHPAPMADWHSHSNSSGCDIVYPYMIAAGIKYGIASITSPSSSSTRPNTWYPSQEAQWGTWGTGGTVGTYISALPGQHANRFEVAQTVTESQDLATCKKVTQRAEQFGGLIVYNLHQATVHNTTLGGGNGWKTLIEYWKAEVDAGRLQILVPSAGLKIYFDNKWSDAMAWGTKDYADLDADTHLDMWMSGKGTAAVADTALLNPFSSAALYKYAGHPTMRLNWTGAGSAFVPADNGSVFGPDSSWEHGNAVKCVFKPAGEGWTIIASMRAICDVTVAGQHPPNTRYVGIDFFAPRAKNSYQYGVSGALAFDYTGAISTTVNYVQDQMSIRGMGEINRPGTQYAFGANNTTTSGSKEWLFVENSWDIPWDAPVVFVNIFKHVVFPANEVIVTDPVIQFYNRNTGEVIDAQ